MSAGAGTEGTAEKLIKLLRRSESPSFSEATLVSGTALQDATGVGTTWYVPIGGHAAGTVRVDIGPTEAVAHNVVAATAGNAVASQTLPVKLPANWWIKVTVAGEATIAAKAQIQT